MFIFAGGLYLIAVGIACALPKELANSCSSSSSSNRRRWRREYTSNDINEDDDEDDINYIPLYTGSDLEETTSRSSYGSV